MAVQRFTFACWHVRAGLLVMFVLAISGCSKPKATVTGMVTYRGEPVSAGSVAFFGSSDQVASAPLDSDGSYEATGVPVGPVKVTVTTPAPGPTADQAAKNPFMKKKGFVPSGEKNVSLPARYSLPASSGLSFTVTEGTQSFDIPLK